jgi:hypothetical protein
MRIKINEAALKRAVAPALKNIADDKTRQMDQLVADYAGHDLDEIKQAIVAMFKRDGGSITDPELTKYAETVQCGQRIVFRGDG